MGILIAVGAQQFAAGTTALTGRDPTSSVEDVEKVILSYILLR
jgi:hypothetical protein